MKVGFFASHGGSNMQAVIDAIHAKRLDAVPALLISNNRQSHAASRAEREGMPFQILNASTHPDPETLDGAMLDALQQHEVELIVLAGFLKKIGPRVLEAYQGRILNIHPSLLPKFGGQGMFGSRVHQAVLDAGETTTGISIHHVNGEYDDGRVIAQCEVAVMPDDTVETLAARVLLREHAFLVETLAKITRGELTL
ncbi:MAG: phosphoribosylglycinamide formyltransferase [Luteolibacter sp.]